MKSAYPYIFILFMIVITALLCSIRENTLPEAQIQPYSAEQLTSDIFGCIMQNKTNSSNVSDSCVAGKFIITHRNQQSNPDIAINSPEFWPINN